MLYSPMRQQRLCSHEKQNCFDWYYSKVLLINSNRAETKEEEGEEEEEERKKEQNMTMTKLLLQVSKKDTSLQVPFSSFSFFGFLAPFERRLAKKVLAPPLPI